MFEINSLNYNHSDVYLMAIVQDSEQIKFRFVLEFTYVEDTGLSAVGLIGIILAILIFIAFAAAVIALLLNRHGIVSFYLPK